MALCLLLSLLYSPSTATALSLASTGSTLLLNGISYYVPATPFVILPSLPTLENAPSAGGLTPVTVISSSANTSLSAADQITANFGIDDVWNEAFLQTVLLQGSSSIGPYSNSSLTSLSIPTNSSSTLPPGPYFASSSGALYQPYRLYSDFAGAFTQPLIPTSNGSYAPLPAAIEGIQAPAVAVPSRLYYTKTVDKALAGVRVGIKDIYDVAGVKTSDGNRAWYGFYPPATANALTVQRLIDAGAIIVGKMKTSQFANGETPTADWVDYHSPFNPRGDGYQDPSSSSSGPGAGEGSYPWLDLSLGSDTGGSVRGPSQVQGLFGNRPSHGSVDLTGVMPLAPQLDTAGILTRDPVLWSSAAAVLYDELPFYTEYPKKLYTIGFPTSTESDADGILLDVLAKIESFLSTTTTSLNLSSAWDANKPSGVSASLNSFLNLTYPILISKEQTRLVRDPFYAAYGATHDGRRPFVDPVPLARWAFSDGYPESAVAEAINNKTIFQNWYSENIQRNDSTTCSDSLVLYSGFGDPAPRNEYLDEPTAPTGFSTGRVSVFAENPDFVFPVGQAAYNSTVTLHEEFLPVTIDIMAARGCDGLLFNLIQDFVEAGIAQVPLTGQTIAGGEILLRRGN